MEKNNINKTEALNLIAQKSALENYSVQSIGFVPYRKGFINGFNKGKEISDSNYERIKEDNAALLEALKKVNNWLDSDNDMEASIYYVVKEAIQKASKYR